MDQNEKIRFDSWGVLLRAHSQTVQKIESRLKANGRVSLLWYDILLAIKKSHEPKVKMSEVVKKVVLTKSGLTRAVENMVKSGLINKEASSEDRRSYVLTITKQGQHEFKKVWKIYKKAINELYLDKLSEKDISCVYSALSKVTADWEKHS